MPTCLPIFSIVIVIMYFCMYIYLCMYVFIFIYVSWRKFEENDAM